MSYHYVHKSGGVPTFQSVQDDGTVVNESYRALAPSDVVFGKKADDLDEGWYDDDGNFLGDELMADDDEDAEGAEYEWEDEDDDVGNDNVSFPIMQVSKSADQQLIWGWALVASRNGEQLIDKQGDIVDINNVRQVAHEYVRGPRVGGLLHMPDGKGGEMPVAEIVESVVFDAPLQKALGVDLGQEGWFIGAKVTNGEVWKMVKAGTLKSFSIGGSGMREAVEKSDPGPSGVHTPSTKWSGMKQRLWKAKLASVRKRLETVAKYNPNHDPKTGKFTTGKGGTALHSEGVRLKYASGLAVEGRGGRGQTARKIEALGRRHAQRAYGGMNSYELGRASAHHLDRVLHYSRGELTGKQTANEMAAAIYHQAISRTAKNMARNRSNIAETLDRNRAQRAGSTSPAPKTRGPSKVERDPATSMHPDAMRARAAQAIIERFGPTGGRSATPSHSEGSSTIRRASTVRAMSRPSHLKHLVDYQHAENVPGGKRYKTKTGGTVTVHDDGRPDTHVESTWKPTFVRRTRTKGKKRS